MPSDVRWYGQQVQRACEREASRRLKGAAMLLAAKIRKNLSAVGSHPSLPGEFPHRVSGDLMDSVRVQSSPRGYVVSATVPYAMYVESMRPFMRRSFLQAKAAMAASLRNGKVL